jgi:hypothetical protein
MLPFWPIDVRASDANCISLGDIFTALHCAFHVRIDSSDWETLSSEDKERVATAFSHRCRAEAVRSGVEPALLHDKELEARSVGLQRVDFLLGKTVFQGLVKVPGDPEGVLRLVTA